MGFSNPIIVGGGPSQQSVYQVSTTARHSVGTRGALPDGREFEYVRSDQSTAIGKGKLATYDPVVAAVDKVSVQAAAAIGATEVAVTVTITKAANALAGGFLSIDDDAGEAELYGITGHAAHTTGTLTLLLDRPLVVAVTTSTTATIVYGPSVKISAAVVAAALPVEVAAGVPLVEIPAGNTTVQYAWIQKTGPANVLFGTAVGAIGGVIYHGEDAGSFQLSVQTTAQGMRVGLGTIMALLPVDTEYHPVRLSIA